MERSLAPKPRGRKREGEGESGRELIVPRRSPCVRLYSRDPIITDPRETITSRRRARCRSYCAPPSAIFYLSPGNTDARLIFFNHGRAASRAVYRGFLTREIHRNLPSFPRDASEFRLTLAHVIAPDYNLPIFSSRFLSRIRSFFFFFYTNSAYDRFREIENKRRISSDVTLTREFLFGAEKDRESV